MRASGIRSYHRPNRLAEALDLVSRGVVPVAGGTRLFAQAHEIANVLDLAALGLDAIEMDDGDLRLGAMVTLQAAADSPIAHSATAGLLPAACLAQQPSRMVRNLATLGGESVFAAHDSEVAAALLALNAVYVIECPGGPIESPAVRFLRNPAEDVAGGLLTALFIPGAPEGAALERVAVLPSAPALVAVAVAVSFSADTCSRARIAVTGLTGAPARVTEAEAKIENTHADAKDIERAAEQVAARAAFRDDAHAPADYRRAVARVLTRRALTRALQHARSGQPPTAPRPRSVPRARTATALPYFTSGRVEMTVNGQSRRLEAEARTTLLDLLRRDGLWGVKHGCETGECGACTVLLDGRPVVSCLTLAVRAQGRAVQTVEGLGTPDALHPVQQAFVDTGAVQCGYCTPAMELCAKALLDAVPDPTDAEIREALAGCLCRCTGYVKPVEAVRRAAGGEAPEDEA
jgi:aerobic-type carbon monoxide dehydrogenase small subunit (CoxS/CutS family)/CO/xanthine dehydrogenase FAD-binding subunit